MVRLQLRDTSKCIYSSLTFNPTMVRLQQWGVVENKITVNFLSIPLWCDCNVAVSTEKIDELVFQSHYGAIATYALSWYLTDAYVVFQSHYGAIATMNMKTKVQHKSAAFNPTMVRLQLGIGHRASVMGHLSIPLWCDCNGKSCEGYGLWNNAFNPTMVRLQQDEF